jgi:hypothetical protein
MNKWLLSKIGQWLLRFVFLFVLVGNGGCQPDTPLDINQVQWSTYTNSLLKYSLQYPNGYTVQQEANGASVMFKTGMFRTPMLVRYTSEAEGKQRGLWFGNQPTAPIELGGKKGYKYVYKHYDGPLGARMIAYVVEYQGQFLGLEFRSDGNDLDAVQKQIVQSFRFE